MSDFNLITNIANGHGLQRDYEIVKAVIERAGHTVYGTQYDNPRFEQNVSVNIFLETVVPNLFRYGQQNWLIPNAEWWDDEANRHINAFSRVLCKTQDSYRLFKSRTDKASFLGFESRDFYQPEIERQPKFLHICGQSLMKNTDPVLAAWSAHDIEFPLTVLTPRNIPLVKHMPQVTFRSRIPEDELITVLNSHRFHLCPSQYEGWGHYLHEARAVGGIIITTNAPPMNEFVGLPKDLFIPSAPRIGMGLAELHIVSPEGVSAAVYRAARMSPERIEELSQQARDGFQAESDGFRAKLTEIVSKI